MFKKILFGLAVILLLAQFIHPEKNNSDNRQFDISTKYNLPNDVKIRLKKSCDDCHSNKTTYPWYAEVQPIAWWLSNHVAEGKGELNFSEFTNRPIAVQNKKFEEIMDEVGGGEMPLSSYTYLGLHAEAKMTDIERKLIVEWAQAQMDSIKIHYPADSLILKKRAE
jgi:hypothetical protein